MKVTSPESVRDNIKKFKHFEIMRPDAIKRIESRFDVDYFPRGNDPFMDSLVETFKKHANIKITNT